MCGSLGEILIAIFALGLVLTSGGSWRFESVLFACQRPAAFLQDNYILTTIR